jgi:hypothetical protein
LAGPSDTLTVQVYSRAYVLLGENRVSGSFRAGWNRVALPPLAVNGTYFYRVVSVRQGQSGLGAGLGRLVIVK